ncbi:uncharacterized protein LOC126682251 [Mercurialis annua]|uniref:uncharacterized protein LOC126682251 n=1 Tax=Mercurialis annua TaxID=3986 RepID=UPI00215EC119|nr:uncharacterized protein LOC126682251 [Mercurialis annua]
MDHRVNPMKASQAWIKKRKAFDQRGDMAIAAWAEQQQLEMNLRVRRLTRSKVSFIIISMDSTLKRYTLVLKKRDLMRKKAGEEKKKIITQLLAAEGLELDIDDDETL